MPKFEPLPPVSGADALLSLLDALKHPKAVEARVKELTDLRDEINASIALHGQAENIPALHDAALADRRKAEDELRGAREKAAEITKNAYASRDAALIEAETARTQASEGRLALEKERSAWEKERGNREAALRALEDDVRKARDAALAHEAKALADRTEWEEKVGRLRAAGVA